MAIEIKTARKKELIAEIDLNDVRYINPIEKGGYALDGQWSDEFHHALHSQLTGETYGYYSDFGEIKQLKKALSQTFVYNGNYSPHRRKFFGSRVESHPYSQFVTFAQNHDQVGNRPLGERLTSLVSFEQLKLAAATVLLSPHIPLLFMGEEYGEKNPFLYFTSHTDIALGEAIRRGRQEEFSYFESPEKVADPQDPATFQRSVLSWNKGSGSSAVLLRYYRHLIALRKNRPALQGSSRDSMQVEEPVGKVIAFQRKISNDLVLIWLNFGGETAWCENSTGDTLLKLFDSSAMEWLGPGADTGWKIAPGGRIQLPPWTALVFERKS